LVSFDIRTAGQILVGPGVRAQVAPAMVALGAKSVLIVSGRDPGRAAALIADLAAHGIAAIAFVVAAEPTVDVVRAGVRAVGDGGVDAVVAIGGGSALDAGKAIAALAANGGDPLDYLEVVGAGRKLARASLPFVAVPTTAGTGSEVTRNAVLSVPEARIKASLRSPLMLPRMAVIDPDLLATAPRAVIASSGLDALSQVIEPFLSNRANPITDSLARDGISRSARALRRAYELGLADAAQSDNREDLVLCSLLGGLCLANAGLGAVHGFAAPLGGMFGAPHGAVCAALLPHVLGVNLRALRAREPAHPALARMLELAHLLTGAPIGDLTADDGIAFVVDLCRALEIPGLGHYGMTTADIPGLVEKAKMASSMKGNPLPLSERELTEIAERALF
jgi:alcohol dehydrogenase class IV